MVWDKTGTLTRGVFEVDSIASYNGFTDDQVLGYAAAAELHSDHPIARSIVTAMKTKGLIINEGEVSDHVAMSGMGVRATYDGKDIAVGNDLLLHQANIEHEMCVFESTVVHVVVDGKYAGHLLIGDQPKPDAGKQSIVSEKAASKHRSC